MASSCKGICYLHGELGHRTQHNIGWGYCKCCNYKFKLDSVYCPCCSYKLRYSIRTKIARDSKR